MKRTTVRPPTSARQRCVAALVLGTALTTFGSTSALGQAPEPLLRTVTDMNRYCTACWRNARLHPDTWTDCTQEVFSRLMERVDPGAWKQALADDGAERREFIRAIDAVKKRTQRGRKWTSDAVETVADPHERQQRRRVEERQAVLEAAASLLSPRQQHIVRLSLDGWSVHDIARDLRVPAERVSDEKYKAIHKLRGHFEPSAVA